MEGGDNGCVGLEVVYVFEGVDGFDRDGFVFGVVVVFLYEFVLGEVLVVKVEFDLGEI